MSLRDKIFKKQYQFKEVKEEFDGEEVLIKQPSVQTRNELIKKASKLDPRTGDFEVDLLNMQIYGIIYCVFDPKTEERIFEETDFDHLSTSPLGNRIVDKLGDQVTEMVSVEVDGKKQEEN